MRDFNKTLTNDHNLGGVIHSEFLIDDFRTTLHYCHLSPLSFTGDVYTWNDKSSNTYNVKERLDHAMIN